jgi:hypothetical protein
MKSSPSQQSKYVVLTPLLVFAAHAAESRTIWLILVVPLVGLDELDELEEGWDKDEEELSSSSLSIVMFSSLLFKGSYMVSKS